MGKRVFHVGNPHGLHEDSLESRFQSQLEVIHLSRDLVRLSPFVDVEKGHAGHRPLPRSRRR